MICLLPANYAEAVRMAFSLPAICGKDKRYG